MGVQWVPGLVARAAAVGISIFEPGEARAFGPRARNSSGKKLVEELISRTSDDTTEGC